MNIKLQSLSKNDLPAIYQSFMEAFSDYVQDASSVTETIFTNRAIKNGVDFGTSVGAFDKGKMVGFTVVAHEDYCGAYSAYDAFTGITKPYRGQGLAKEMFEFLVPKLKAKGVKRFYLEVIQKNEPAVRAYKKSGFEIIRELDAFEIKFENAPHILAVHEEIEIRPIIKSELAPVAEFFDWQPTWENSLASIQRIPDEVLILGAFYEKRLAGFLVYYPLLNWILNMAVNKSYRRKKIGTSLIASLKEEISNKVPATKIINVEHTDRGMIEFLESTGFEYFLNQYEMKLDL